MTLTINPKQLLAGLGIFLLGLAVGLWQPWAGGNRQVTVTGSATVKAAPDEFLFYPSYQADTTDKVRKTGDAVVAKLKDLGVKDEQIRTDVGNQPVYRIGGDVDDQAVYSLTISLNDKDLAQKVQDYLLTTNNKGSSTPQSTFSTAKQNELKAQARKEAVAQARTQADQIADELGSRVGKANSVEEVSGFDFPVAYGRGEVAVDSGAKTQTKLLTGEQELTFSVRVVFRLR